MNKWQRKVLDETRELCSDMGGSLDGTSTHPSKYQDRQRCLGKISTILYCVLCIHPENDNPEYERELVEEALQFLKDMKNKKYPDRKGNY